MNTSATSDPDSLINEESVSCTDDEIDVSLLLENTRATSEPDRLIDEAMGIDESRAPRNRLLRLQTVPD